MQPHHEATTVPASEGATCWCLHGSAGLYSDWKSVRGGLAEMGVVTRAVDLWRFLQCQAMDYRAFGAALNAEANALPAVVGPRVLVGYSMGGRLALHGILDEASEWDAAVIISAHPGLVSEEERMARRAADAVWAARAMKDEWSDFMEAWNQQPVLRGAKVRGEGEDFLLKNRRVEIARSFIEWSLGMQRPLWERLSEIQIPVLWVVGERDENYLQMGKEAVKKIPRGELWVAPGAGHRVPWEAEIEFLAVLSGFIQKLRA